MTVISKKKILDQLEDIPENLIIEVLEYINYLKFRNIGKSNSSDTVNRNVKLSDFSFTKSRKVLKNIKGSLSDAVIGERRSYL